MGATLGVRVIRMVSWLFLFVCVVSIPRADAAPVGPAHATGCEPSAQKPYHGEGGSTYDLIRSQVKVSCDYRMSYGEIFGFLKRKDVHDLDSDGQQEVVQMDKCEDTTAATLGVNCDLAAAIPEWATGEYAWFSRFEANVCHVHDGQPNPFTACVNYEARSSNFLYG